MDKWINDAFNNAEKQVEHAKKVSDRIDFFMNENCVDILENWGDMVGDENANHMGKVMMDNDTSDLMYSLCRAFAVAGYYWRIIDERNGVK